jgi:Ca2+-binding RTX toxin-like protein
VRQTSIATFRAAIDGTGNSLANAISGNAADNTLSGGGGPDTLTGGDGNDTYLVNLGDMVVEATNGGVDTVKSNINWVLAANVENLTLTGSGNTYGTGNNLNNGITGNGGANTLDGGAGADTLAGGAGNDTYLVDDGGDLIIEVPDEGSDTVQASVTYVLGANLENLFLTGGSATNATGNDKANKLTGNAADNRLDGGAGADTLAGGGGNDIYLVDDIADKINEVLNEGEDSVLASVSYTLPANLEKLSLTGTSAINGTGNSLANTLSGNSGDNVLSGGGGADTLIGGDGNDTYIAGTGDTIVEAVNGGIDTVQSNVNWVLEGSVENLLLTGTGAIKGTGNASDNILTGNSAANTLTGNGGADTLDGKAGADILIGGTGNDTYWLGRGWGHDTIQENDVTTGNTDIARFDVGIATDQLWFQHVGNNLEVSIIGTTDQFTLSNWYTGSANHVEQFKTSNGKTLLDSQVQSLVSAMAAFSPPAAGQTTLPANYSTTLAPVIAANWV